VLLNLIFAPHGDDMTDNYDKIFGEYASSAPTFTEHRDIIEQFLVDKP
jgi:hypothetical protein